MLLFLLLTPLIFSSWVFKEKIIITKDDGTKIRRNNPHEVLVQRDIEPLKEDNYLDSDATYISFIRFTTNEKFVTSPYDVITFWNEYPAWGVYWLDLTDLVGNDEELDELEIYAVYGIPEKKTDYDHDLFPDIQKLEPEIEFSFLSNGDCPTVWTKYEIDVNRFLVLSNDERDHYSKGGNAGHTHQIGGINTKKAGAPPTDEEDYSAQWILWQCPSGNDECNMDEHTHDIDIHTTNSVNTHFPSYSLQLCKFTGTYIPLESNLVVPFGVKQENRFSGIYELNTKGRFALISNTHGTAIGAKQHYYFLNMDTHASSNTAGRNTGYPIDEPKAYTRDTHTHIIFPSFTKNDDIEETYPKNVKLYFASPNSWNSRNYLFPGAYIFADKKPPLGYEDIDVDYSERFVRGTKTESKIMEMQGSTGEHTHTYSGTTTLTNNPLVIEMNAQQCAPCGDEHYHEYFGTSSTETHNPYHLKLYTLKRSNHPLTVEIGEISEFVCDSNRVGSECENEICYEKIDYDDHVCSGKGECVSYNDCNCEEEYSGDECEYWYCNSIRFDETDSCNQGECISPETCVCPDMIYGQYCDIYECYDLLSNETACNYPNGTCDDVNTCTCQRGYHFSQCEIWECYGVLMNDSSVCSGNGTCVGLDNCSCFSGSDHETCSYYTCYGIPMNETASCNKPNGTCASQDKCICKEGYELPYCNTWKCGDYLKNETEVCSSNGSCVSPDLCICNTYTNWMTGEEFPFEGELCELWRCNGKLSNNYSSGVCNWPNGVCSSPERCTCEENYLGLWCESWKCNGKWKNDTLDDGCGNYGTCVGPDQCECIGDYTGNRCETYECNGILWDEGACNYPNGTCQEPTEDGEYVGECSCEDGYFGDDCESWYCFEKRKDDNAVCGGDLRGSCVGKDSCLCLDDYFGSECQYTTCFGIMSNDTESCSYPNGECIDVDSCECFDEYFGDECEYFFCYGKYSNGTKACSYPNGTCQNKDYCLCEDFFLGVDCKEWECFGKHMSDETVCSYPNGTCVGAQKCHCPGYNADNACRTWYCWDYESSDSRVCSGHGSCTEPNVCLCDENYHDYNCSEWTCYNEPINTACSSPNGTCLGHNKCSCGQYSGDICETWSCGLYTNIEEKVCNMHGYCIAPEECLCTQGWSGGECETEPEGGTSSMAIFWYILGSSIPILGIIICLLLCFIGIALIFHSVKQKERKTDGEMEMKKVEGSEKKNVKEKKGSEIKEKVEDSDSSDTESEISEDNNQNIEKKKKNQKKQEQLEKKVEFQDSSTNSETSFADSDSSEDHAVLYQSEKISKDVYL